MMVHFFGVLNPTSGPRSARSDAPHKVDFFGGAGESDQVSRAEFDADLLSGKIPETAGHFGREAKERRFVHLSVPPYF